MAAISPVPPSAQLVGWPPFHSPVSAGSRPDFTALAKASWSGSFWSAYVAAKSAIARSPIGLERTATSRYKGTD